MRFLALAALAALSSHAAPLLHTLTTNDGVNYSLSAIQSGGALTELFKVGIGYNGGLAYDPLAARFYAISNDADGKSILNSIDWDGNVSELFTVGQGFYGGLTLDSPGKLLAIAAEAKDGLQRSLYSIDVAAASSSLLADLGDGATVFTALDRSTALTLVGLNEEGFGLYTYEPLNRTERLDGIHQSLVFPAAGGLAWDSDAGAWRIISIDPETFSPIIATAREGAIVDQWRLDLAASGLTFADKDGGGPPPSEVPEPAPSALIATGLAALLYLRRR